MRDRTVASFALVLAVCAPLAWAFGTGEAPPPPPPTASRAHPPLATLEGGVDEDGSMVVIHEGHGGVRELGRVAHAPGGARRGVVLRGGGDPVVLVVAQERLARGASTYDSALWRVDARGARRLVGDLTNASRPLVTAHGTVLVQRGAAGEEPALTGHTLRERRDRLSLDAVDPVDGTLRTVWQGHGQVAFLAGAPGDDRALVYHLDGHTAALREIDAASGAERTLGEDLHLARDFTHDRARDAVVFVRAAEPGTWEVTALSRRDGSRRTLFTAAHDHLMPFALADGRVALSLPGEAGLGLLSPGSPPRRLAPRGAGSDAVLAAHTEWIALRHSEIDTEETVLWHLPSGAVRVLPGGAERVREVLGFVEAP